MPKVQLHTPAWYHATEGDKPARIDIVYLDHLPRVDDQIEVPNGGVVEVRNVRFRPQWRGDGMVQAGRGMGDHWEHEEYPPEVFTSWAWRPEGAPKTRTPPHKLGHGR